MGYNIEFSFLGRRHNYVVSVTRVASSGYWIETLDTACFRVPISWTDQYTAFASTRYIFDIRGHDFLSHTGQWRSEDARGISPKSENIITEIDALRALGEDLEAKGYSKADVKLSFGPQPGSFFADVKKFKEYRWENLPRDLNFAIQRELAEEGYGTIAGVAINATGGWVMHFNVRKWFSKQKHQFRWGGGEGALPKLLVTALEQGRERGAKIMHIFLNPQHSDEFVLLFSDGYTHFNLHYNFETRIRELVDLWVVKTLKKSLNWNFTYSCQCLESQQKRLDAKYYNLRGRFFLQRSSNSPELSCKNIDLALDYLGEAIRQDPKSEEIANSQRMALAAARAIKKDVVLEAKLANAFAANTPQEYFLDFHDSSPTGLFRNQYLQLIRTREDYENLISQWNRLTSSPSEWSYLMAGIEPCSHVEMSVALNSMVMPPPPLSEVLGSIPAEHHEQSVLAQRRASEPTQQSSTRGIRASSSVQARTSPMRNSPFGNIRALTFPFQRRPSELSSEQRDTRQMRVPEQTYTDQMIAPEQSNDQDPTAGRRPSWLSYEQYATAQRRPSELDSMSPGIFQDTPSELANNEVGTAQRRSERGESQFHIHSQ